MVMIFRKDEVSIEECIDIMTKKLRLFKGKLMTIVATIKVRTLLIVYISEGAFSADRVLFISLCLEDYRNIRKFTTLVHIEHIICQQPVSNFHFQSANTNKISCSL